MSTTALPLQQTVQLKKGAEKRLTETLDLHDIRLRIEVVKECIDADHQKYVQTSNQKFRKREDKRLLELAILQSKMALLENPNKIDIISESVSLKPTKNLTRGPSHPGTAGTAVITSKSDQGGTAFTASRAHHNTTALIPSQIPPSPIKSSRPSQDTMYPSRQEKGSPHLKMQLPKAPTSLSASTSRVNTIPTGPRTTMQNSIPTGSRGKMQKAPELLIPTGLHVKTKHVGQPTLPSIRYPPATHVERRPSPQGFPPTRVYLDPLVTRSTHPNPSGYAPSGYPSASGHPVAIFHHPGSDREGSATTGNLRQAQSYAPRGFTPSHQYPQHPAIRPYPTRYLGESCSAADGIRQAQGYSLRGSTPTPLPPEHTATRLNPTRSDRESSPATGSIRRPRGGKRDAIVPPSEKSGGVPDPLPDYLSRTLLEPQAAMEHQPILLVIDLNGTVLFRPDRAKPFHFIERPLTQLFFDYAFSRFSIMIWSSARPDNVAKMCNKLFTPTTRPRLVAEWARDRMGLDKSDYDKRVQVYKRLGLIWQDGDIQKSHPRHSMGWKWDQTNTILIDDSSEKARSEPHNLLQIPEFENAKDEPVDVLRHLADYLELLKTQINVSSYIRKNPFMLPSTASHEA